MTLLIARQQWLTITDRLDVRTMATFNRSSLAISVFREAVPQDSTMATRHPTVERAAVSQANPAKDW
jgi:hypothetical protein